MLAFNPITKKLDYIAYDESVGVIVDVSGGFASLEESVAVVCAL